MKRFCRECDLNNNKINNELNISRLFEIKMLTLKMGKVQLE